MSFTLPWIKKKREERTDRDARSHNTEEENTLLEIAQRRFVNAQSSKTNLDGEDLHSVWKEFDKIYRNKQWSQPAPPGKSQPVLNYTLALIESVVPRITANHPEVLVVPRRDPANKPLADQLTYTHRYLWHINRMSKMLPSATRSCLKYGTIIFKTIWDPDFFDDYGEVCYSVVHPMNFFPDPRAYEVDQMEYCFTRVPKALEYFERRWPEKGGLVVPDHDWTDTEQVGTSDSYQEEEVASLNEYWFRDEEGRVCCMYYAGDVVLDIIGGDYDGTGDPVFKHNKFPFAKFVDYEVDKNFWGIGEIEIAVMIQRLINSFEAQIIDNTRLMANNEWVVSMADSGLTEDDAWIFDNRPGNVIFTHRDGVRKEPGTPIPHHIPEHMDNLVFMLEQILGVHDVVQGRRPVGVRAASAIIALQEAANVRVEQKIDNLSEALQDMVEQATWLILANYDEPRSMRLAGSAVPTTLNIREILDNRMREQADAVGMTPGIVEEMGFEPDTGIDQLPQMQREEAMDQVYQELRFPDFDVEIKVGPGIPQSQALRYEQAKEFFQLGIVDRRAVLEATNFPGWEEILARMEQQQAQAAQEEQEQQEERVGERTYGGQQMRGM